MQFLFKHISKKAAHLHLTNDRYGISIDLNCVVFVFLFKKTCEDGM